MRRMNRRNWILYVIGALFVIGLLYRIGSNPVAWLIPIIVLGGVFWLYKYPPQRWRSAGRPAKPRTAQPRYGPSAQTSSKRAEKVAKRSNFRVIKGSKPDGDDDLPKYH